MATTPNDTCAADRGPAMDPPTTNSLTMAGHLGRAHGALSNPTFTLDESLPHSYHVIPWAQEKTAVPQSGNPAEETPSPTWTPRPSSATVPGSPTG